MQDTETAMRLMLDTADTRDDLRIHPRLKYLFFELTDCCNLACLHCGSRCSGRNHRFLDTDAVIRIVRETRRRAGMQAMICLTGGEPMLHPDFYRIAEAIHEEGLPWGMTTNGTCIDDRAAERLCKAGRPSISVSLDGTRAYNDWFRGRRGSFERALQGIRALRQAGLPVLVTTVVTRKNLRQLDEIFDIVRELGCSWRLTNMEPIGRALDHPELLLCREEFLFLLDYIKGKREDDDVSYGCSHLLPLMYEQKVRGWPFICSAGIMTAGITAGGDIVSCLDVERRPDLIQGHIFTEDFFDVWENRFAVYRTDRTADSPVCSSCSMRRICGGDSCHTWDFDRHAPRMCLMRGME